MHQRPFSCQISKCCPGLRFQYNSKSIDYCRFFKYSDLTISQLKSIKDCHVILGYCNTKPKECQGSSGCTTPPADTDSTTLTWLMPMVQGRDMDAVMASCYSQNRLLSKSVIFIIISGSLLFHSFQRYFYVGPMDRKEIFVMIT